MRGGFSLASSSRLLGCEVDMGTLLETVALYIELHGPLSSMTSSLFGVWASIKESLSILQPQSTLAPWFLWKSQPRNCFVQQTHRHIPAFVTKIDCVRTQRKQPENDWGGTRLGRAAVWGRGRAALAQHNKPAMTASSKPIHWLTTFH